MDKSSIVQFGYEIRVKEENNEKTMQIVFKYRFRDNTLNENEDGYVLEVFDITEKEKKHFQAAMNDSRNTRIGFQ